MGVAIGDVGEDSPEAEMAWGTEGPCAVYEDAWDNSYLALGPGGWSYTPNVRTVGVSLDDLERLLASIERVEP